MHFIPVDYSMCSYNEKKPKTKRKQRCKRSAEVAARRKSKKKSRRTLLKYCRKYLVLKKYLAQQSKTSASEGDPQAYESIYYSSSHGEINTKASSKSENIDLYPTESITSSYSGYNHFHGLKTSLADAYS